MKLRHLLPILILAATSLHATQTDNHGIHAVPAPGPVTIDGKLDDWDLSGQVVMCYDLENLRDIYSAEVAMMHDAEALYVAIHWKDPQPMGNSHHPRYQANKGWAGDAVQLRIKTDRISHLTAWYYAPAKEPAFQIDYGKDLNEPFKGGSTQLYRTEGWKLEQGAEMAFLQDADGHGYVQEMKIPWKLITLEGKPVAPGAAMACGVELLWGEGDWPVHRYADNMQPGTTSREFFWTAHKSWGPVFIEAKGRLSLPEPDFLKAARAAEEKPQGPVEVRYELPKDARVTLAIDDASGARVRNLIAAAPRRKGANVDRWDGLDDNGKLAAPGSYKVTGLYHDGIHASYRMSFANPGNPTWDSPDNRGAFYGDHTAAQAVAAAGEYVALACPMGEAGKHLIGLTLDGQRLWGLNNRVAFDGGRIALATDGQTLWVATEGKRSIIYRVNIANGQYVPWQQMAKDAQGKEFALLDLEASDLPGIGADQRAGANMTAIALQSGVLAVAFARENKIELRDAQTGAAQKRVELENPRNVVFDYDGSLVALSGPKLVRISPSGAVRPFASGEFPDAYGLAIDSARSIYVSVRGTEQNVKVLSPAGKLVREIGKRGGRTDHGAYDAGAMRLPAQIAIDARGRLWVAEETMNPKRTSLWNAADGQLLRDFAGSTHYCSSGSINPDDPTMGFSDDTVYHIDLATGASQPAWSLGQPASDDALFPAAGDARSRIFNRDGETFAFTTGSANGSTEVQCTILKDGRWRSAAHVGTVRKPKDGRGHDTIYGHPFFAGHEGEVYAWADQNGDEIVQPEELHFARLQVDGQPARLRSYYWGQLPDPTGTIIYMIEKQPMLAKFPIKGLTPCGAPIYDVAAPQVVKVDSAVLGGGNGEGMLVGGSGGRVYINQDPLLAIDANGRVLGAYPNHNTSVHGSHSATSARPGYLIGPSSILGTASFGDEVGEVFYLNGNLGENYAFTQDGLFIQSLFKDLRGGFETPAKAVPGMPMDNTTAGGESFGGNFVRMREGKVLLTLGATDARVLELTGFESIHRIHSNVTLTPENATAAQRLAMEKAAQVAEARTFKIARTDTPPVIDGKATDWPELLDDKSAAALEIQESAQKRFGRVAARYDAGHLYLAWRVLGRPKLVNAGQDAKLLFKSGDAVDLMLGPDPQKPKGEGNLRLLLSLLGGKPVAILNQKFAPGAAARERYEFTSPWRAIAFDRVAPADDVQVAVGSISGGSLVEAAIPWKLLGVTPQPGLKLKADFGILSADSGGTQTIARQYWSNKSTNLVNDVPGEADLTPQLWGSVVLE